MIAPAETSGGDVLLLSCEGAVVEIQVERKERTASMSSGGPFEVRRLCRAREVAAIRRGYNIIGTGQDVGRSADGG